MQDHLTREEAERLLCRRCHVSLAYGWLLHLLGCATCRRLLLRSFPGEGDRFLRQIFCTQDPVAMSELRDPETLDRILAHLKSRGIESFLDDGSFPEILDDLHRQPWRRQQWVVRNSRALQDPEVAEELLAQCQLAWHRDATSAHRLARLALLVTDHLSVREVHPDLLYELRFEAWGKLGNSLRVLGRFGPAGRALDKARGYWEGAESPVKTPSLKAQQLRYEALLLRASGRQELALDLASQSEVWAREAGSSVLESLGTETIITNSLAQLGRHEEAQKRMEALLDRISVEDVGVPTYAALLSNLARILASQGLSLPAWSCMQESARLSQGVGKITRLRMTWTSAGVYESLGDLLTAEELYRGVLETTRETLLVADQAMVSIDLARLAVRKRDRPAARRLTHDASRRLPRIGRHDLALAVQQMAAGGPLVHI